MRHSGGKKKGTGRMVTRADAPSSALTLLTNLVVHRVQVRMFDVRMAAA
jgi:hypothetical protein